jgi:hypothetical protein
MNGDSAHPYLGNNRVAILEQVISTASLIKEVAGVSVPLAVSTSKHNINKFIFPRIGLIMLIISMKTS